MKAVSKKVRWWLAGVATLVGVALLLALMPARAPIELAVAGRTTNAFGERVVLGVTNRANQDCGVIVRIEAQTGEIWTPVDAMWEATNPPESRFMVSFGGRSEIVHNVSARAGRTFKGMFPADASSLRVTYVILPQPGRLEEFLRRCAAILGLRYPHGAPVERKLEIER